MAEYPSISKGLGKLTPALWQRILRMLRDYESSYPRDERRVAGGGPSTDTKPFLALITGSSSAGTNRYYYEWEERRLGDGTNVFTTVTDGLSGDYALNTCEANNGSDDVGPGVYVGSPYYPIDWDMMPIGESTNDANVGVVVVMHAVTDAGGATRYVFSMANAHDGDEC